MARVRHHVGDDPSRVVFVSHAGTDVLEPFFAKRGHWPEARVLSDPERVLDEPFGVERGSIGQMFSPGAILAGIRALFRGHFVQVRPPRSDPWTMPSWHLVERRRDGTLGVTWSHVGRHSGDEPAELPAVPRDAA